LYPKLGGNNTDIIMNPKLLLLSGGIDSTTLLADLTRQKGAVTALSFDYGQKHQVELDFAQRNASKYGVKAHYILPLAREPFEHSALVNKDCDLATYQNKPLPTGQVNAYVPFRNLVFLSYALGLAQTLNIKDVYIAVNQDDSSNFWDCTSDFVQNLQNLVQLGSEINLCAPFLNRSKKEVIALANQLDVDLNQTISCYQPMGQEICKICLSCRLRAAALA
jgi:7-cyano-7-deazaguanine synthase